MQFKATLLAIFAVAVAAQDLSSLPGCARPCFARNFGKSGCASRNDFACLCGSKAFTQSAIGCVVGACKGDDLYVARYHLSHRPLDLPEEVSEFTVTDQSGKQLQGSTDCF